MDFSRYRLHKLDDKMEIKSFDCGNEDLNEFLYEDAKLYTSELLAVTYILEDNRENKTVAYYSLLNDKIELDPEEKSVWNKINRKIPNSKRYHAYPAVKIGRLAVSKDYAHQNFGNNIITNIKIQFSIEGESGCRFITVDAYSQAIPFYEKCGFKFLTKKDEGESTRAMYFDLMYFKHR